jgi:hypothetical protein
MARIKDKKKPNTLDATRTDWNKLKQEDTSMAHEIAQQCQKGYLDRQEFLARADVMEFQKEMAAKRGR